MEAEQAFLSLLTSAPHDPELRFNCALALIRGGRATVALQHTRDLLTHHPDWPGSHAIHGEALLSLGEYQAAQHEFEWVLAHLPMDPLANLKRGMALASLGNFDDAERAFEEARRADGGFVERFCRELSSNPEAPAELDPRVIFLWRQYLAQGDCAWRDRDRYIAEFRNVIRDPSARLDRALVFSALHLPLDARERRDLAARVAQEIERRIPPLAPPPTRSASRLRIGVLSPDLHEHVNAHLLLPLFELADRSRFEFYAYSLGRDDRSAVRERIRSAAVAFRDLRTLNAASAAQQIRRDGIDILVDAGGYGEGARFEIVASRPAPLQVLYLCFASTLGSTRVDYTILDATVAPPGHQAYWSEQIVNLPDTYFLYDYRAEPRDDEVSRSEYKLPEDRPVLCAFHKGAKIDPDSFSLWMEILRAHPAAVLWLLEEQPTAATHLRSVASEAGVDPARLHFCHREAHARYMARFGLADLFLDATHHNAIVTTCDCLAAGLPVLTLHGSTCTSLSAESLLRAAHLPELVATDPGDYVRKAVELLEDRVRLAALKQRVRAERRRAPLFDTRSRVRELEAAFTEMWRRHLAGSKPAPFSVARGGSSAA